MWGSWYLLGSRDGRAITSVNAGMPRNIPYLCFGDARLALGVETVVVPVFCPVVGPVIVRAVDEGDVVVEIVVAQLVVGRVGVDRLIGRPSIERLSGRRPCVGRFIATRRRRQRSPAPSLWAHVSPAQPERD